MDFWAAVVIGALFAAGNVALLLVSGAGES